MPVGFIFPNVRVVINAILCANQSLEAMSIPAIVAIIAVLYILGYLLYVVFYAMDLYQLNPFVKLRPIQQEERLVLVRYFPIYGRLPEQYLQKFHLRLAWFRSKKNFVFYGDIRQKEELKLLLSASVVFMTLGLRNYKMLRSLLRVIVYPTNYYSRINRRHHLGEYNPRFKTVILSADKIWEGFAVTDDNINLAIHEFAHALSFEMLKTGSWEARRFRVGIRQIGQLFEIEEFRVKLVSSSYFREYGMTNLQEFFSVAVENYFETPSVFHHDFPELFNIIQQMLNFDYEISCIFNPPKD